MKTLIAMANTEPNKEGAIVIGISDKESDAIDFKNFYGVSPQKYNDYYVTGIQSEAVKYYDSVQRYMDFIKNSIENEKEKVSSSVIHSILTTIDLMRYGDQILIVLKLSTDKPLFYDEKLFVRYDSHNHFVKAGTDEYYEVINKFITKQ